ncbi:MAG: hypothetical protein V7K53_06005 [Nostoc sp.]|uniref:hypothetical protein n=1 Tax=Nostoc sp. TaxID=1180 RepID=UPI002FF6D5B5
MANINQVSFKSICNQKVTVKELIDGELKGIVGGTSDSFISELNVTSTDENGSSIVTSAQQTVARKDGVKTRRIKETTTFNGQTQIIESVETLPI